VSIRPDSTLREVAFEVCTALDHASVRAVLTGGSAATVWAPEACQSLDLDFIVEFQARKANPASALARLGYRLDRDHYTHGANPLIVEFPAGPLAVGGEILRRWSTLREGRLLLRVLSPTDSVRDRLAGFLFWNDRGSLRQALGVARAQRRRVRVATVREWCEREGHSGKFDEFERTLRANG
jgi:hypothetical protein